MIRVGVLRGGTNGHYDVSLASGAYVLKNLPRDICEPLDLYVDPDGAWHLGGRPISAEQLSRRVDVVWNTLNGFYGGDGKLQQLLETLGVPYVGSGPLSSALTVHRKLFKDQLAGLGIRTPRGAYIESWGDGERAETVAGVVQKLARDYSPPWIVQPISRGYDMPPGVARTRHELEALLGGLYDFGVPVLVEEAVLGTRASVSLVPGFRGETLYSFLPSSEKKLSAEARAALLDAARRVHQGLLLGHYSRIEAIVTPKGHVYIIDAATVPDFSPAADMHSALESVGASFEELARHIIRTAAHPRHSR